MKTGKFSPKMTGIADGRRRTHRRDVLSTARGHKCHQRSLDQRVVVEMRLNLRGFGHMSQVYMLAHMWQRFGIVRMLSTISRIWYWR